MESSICDKDRARIRTNWHRLGQEKDKHCMFFHLYIESKTNKQKAYKYKAEEKAYKYKEQSSSCQRDVSGQNRWRRLEV